MPDKRNPYEAAANVLLAETGCTVRKWRKNTTGTAYTRSDDWGIEAPRPRGPLSFATFAHEVGHQLMHRFNGAPRWLEECEAWEYALEQFARFDLSGVEVARLDAAMCLRYAATKAAKRCSPETAQRILERYPAWAWGDRAAGEVAPALTR